MIEYSPNRDWLRDLRHLGASWTLRRIVRAALMVGLYAGVLSVVMFQLGWEKHRLTSGVFSLLGVILSIILAFRTSTSYDRWWEGRKQWGTLVNHSRNLAIQLNASLPNENRHARSDFARMIGNFAVALSQHLRGEPHSAALLQDGDQEIGHLPVRLANEITRQVHSLRREEEIGDIDVVALKPHTQALLDVAGACERIRKTPIPFSYSVFIKLFIVLYAAILPVGLVPEYGYFAVPLTMLIVFALLGLELMSEEIEDPFGLDCNDLPTGTIAATIASDAATILGVAKAVPQPKPEPYTKIF